jgi:hypothetical protein
MKIILKQKRSLMYPVTDIRDLLFFLNITKKFPRSVNVPITGILLLN